MRTGRGRLRQALPTAPPLVTKVTKVTTWPVTDGVHLTRGLRKAPQLRGLPKPPPQSSHEESVAHIPAEATPRNPCPVLSKAVKVIENEESLSEQLSRPRAAPDRQLPAGWVCDGTLGREGT